MTKCLFLAFALLLCFGTTFAAAPESPFKLTATMGQQTMLPYEPLGVAVTLINTSAQRQTIDEFSFDTWVEIRRDGEEEWQRYRGEFQGPGFMPAVPLHPRTFHPYESVHKFINLHVQIEQDEEYDRNSTYLLNHPFDEPGTYWIRARTWEFSDTTAQRLEVKEPGPDDKAAYLYLKKMPIYRAFALDQVLVEYESVRQEQADRGRRDVDKAEFSIQYPALLQQFIQHFPKSYYAYWARLALLNVQQAPFMSRYYRGEPVTEFIDGMRTLRKEMEQLASNAPLTVAAVAWFYAGLSAGQNGDAMAAEAAFRHAIETKDASMPARIAARRG